MDRRSILNQIYVLVSRYFDVSCLCLNRTLEFLAAHVRSHCPFLKKFRVVGTIEKKIDIPFQSLVLDAPRISTRFRMRFMMEMSKDYIIHNFGPSGKTEMEEPIESWGMHIGLVGEGSNENGQETVGQTARPTPLARCFSLTVML